MSSYVNVLLIYLLKLLRLKLFTRIATYIYSIFGNILRTTMPFFAFMLILIIGFGHSM
jgi:hypothetical protein